MKKWVYKFQNRSLGSKMVILICSIVLLLQIVNGVILRYIVEDGFEDHISQLNLLTVNQMGLNLNRSLEDIMEELVIIRENISSPQLTKGEESELVYLKQRIDYQDYFNDLLSSDDNYKLISSMVFLDRQGNQHAFYAKKENTIKDIDLYEEVIKDYPMLQESYWSGVITDDYYFQQKTEEIISVIMPVFYYESVQSILVVNLSVSGIRAYLSELAGDQMPIAVQINEDEVLQTNSKEIVNTSANATHTLNINGWTLSIFSSNNSNNESFNVLIQFIILILGTTAIILLLSLSYIVYIITKPINKMTMIMELNRNNAKLNHRFYPKYDDEVGKLATTYNSLMDEIQLLMKNIEQEQADRGKMYLQLLQMQINPHFLYNTLESVKFLVEMKDERAAEMLITVGKFYKLSLSGIYDTVRIEEEIQQLSYYIEILKMRYTSQYDFSISVCDEILQSEIVKFTLQPLVENAVYHGVKQKRVQGKIEIKGLQRNGEIHIIIWDNGKGISEDKLKDIRRKLLDNENVDMASHIGIINVHKRIQMQYGADYGISVNSEENEFTEVTVRIPSKTNEGVWGNVHTNDRR